MVVEIVWDGKACYIDPDSLGKTSMKRLRNNNFVGGTGASLWLCSLVLFLTSFLLLSAAPGVRAQSTQNNPYFSALKADKVNVRKGPGLNFDVLWVFHSIGLPVEVTASHEHWRRVRDSGGSEGWVYFRMLSRLRMALISPWKKQKTIVPLYKTKNKGSAVVANLEAGVKVLVKSCDGRTCLISLAGFKGWIKQAKLWGVYPGEIIQ